MLTHPDKNRDGRAGEAFIAVENSASILSDEGLREKYDAQIRIARSKNRDKVKKIVGDGVAVALKTLQNAWKVFKKVL